jgi:hypothetical protein
MQLERKVFLCNGSKKLQKKDVKDYRYVSMTYSRPLMTYPSLLTYDLSLLLSTVSEN